MSSSKRSTGGARARAGPEVGQSTISFASRVTKPVTRDATKKAALSDAPAPRKTTVEVTPPSKDEAEETPVEDVSLEEVEPVEEEEVTPDEEKSEAELRAEQVSDREIAGYWAKLESERIAPRVHQEGVTLSEKVLRYFDVSSQYGVSSTTPSPLWTPHNLAGS